MDAKLDNILYSSTFPRKTQLADDVRPHAMTAALSDFGHGAPALALRGAVIMIDVRQARGSTSARGPYARQGAWASRPIFVSSGP